MIIAYRILTIIVGVFE